VWSYKRIYRGEKLIMSVELKHEQRERAREVGKREVEVGVEVGSNESLEALQSEIESGANGLKVTDFKCQACGLAHGHDTDKHRASDSFSLSHDEAAQMEGANPNCHCGAHYLAKHGSDFGVDESDAASVASGAPVPESVQKRFN
jgi:hypothetical protein